MLFKSLYPTHHEKLRPIINEGRGLVLCVITNGGWGNNYKDETGTVISDGEIVFWLNETQFKCSRMVITGSHLLYEFEDRESCMLFKMAHSLTQTLKGYDLVGSHQWGHL